MCTGLARPAWLGWSRNVSSVRCVPTALAVELPILSLLLGGQLGEKSVRVLLIVAAVVCLALAVFYAVPGPYHPFTFSGTPTGTHPTHAVVFLALAAFSAIGARFLGAQVSGQTPPRSPGEEDTLPDRSDGTR
jgi:hypothetical protein